MQLRLGIDLDGVVADFNAGWMRRYNSDFGSQLTPEHVVAWDGLHGLTHFPDMEAFWAWAADHDGHSVFRHLDCYEDALPALTRLTDAGHDVVILTAKPAWAVHDTFRWIADHALPTREVHMIEAKHRVACDVYLDDSPHVLPALVAERPDAVVCRLVAAWNRPVAGARDVADWAGFEKVVGEVAGTEASVG